MNIFNLFVLSQGNIHFLVFVVLRRHFRENVCYSSLIMSARERVSIY